MRKFFFPSTLVLILLLICHTSDAQDFSNRGKDFWIAYAGHIDGTASVMGLYLTSDVNTSGNVQVGTKNIPFTITANQVTKLFLGPNGAGDAPNTSVYNNQSDGVNPGAGIHITAQKRIVAYAHIIRAARSGASLILPTPVLGREYIIPSYRNLGTQNGQDYGYGQITVVAVQPNTTIEIIPTIRDRNGNHPAGTAFRVTLPNQGDVYQLQGQQNGDFSGSIVRSVSSATGTCQPIAVFSSTTWSAFDCPGSSGGDNLYQELFPTKSWGKKFITAPFISKLYDIIRIFVKDPTTVVTITEGSSKTVLSSPLPGNYYEIKTSSPTVIEADKQISVVQYITSQTCGGSQSDPEMVLINPIEQTLTDITLFSAHKKYVPANQTQVTSHYINIVIPTSKKQTLVIDNHAPTGKFVDIPGAGYSYLQEDVTASSAINPVHNIKADTGFTAIVYGYGDVESYGYNAGTNLRDLSQFVSVNNQYATVDIPAACKSSPFSLSMTFPYQPTQIIWQFNGLFPDVTLNNPSFNSSSVVDGRTLYKYDLAGTYTAPATPGTYPITVMAQNPTADGCNGLQEIDYDLEVYDLPIASFNFTTDGCVSSPVVFSDNSNSSGHPIIHRHWDFGDGNKEDNTTVATHSYERSGTYNVKYTIITDIGCKADTTVRPVIANALPVADFTSSLPGCVSQGVKFTDMSRSDSGHIVKWTWDLGDGNNFVSTNGNSFVHNYSATGTYPLSLKVETDRGCSDTINNRNIVINPVPEAAFTAPQICVSDIRAPFQDASSIQSGNIASWEWTFGDANSNAVNPNVSISQNTFHHYSLPGDYTAQLITTSNAGCKDTVQHLFTVNGAVLTPGFTVENTTALCSNNDISIKDASQVDAGRVIRVEIYWDENDETIRTMDESPAFGKVYSHRYPEFGSPSTRTYTIRYDVYSGISCVKTYSLPITLLATPELTFDPIPAVCSNAPSFHLSAQLQNNMDGSGEFSGTGVSSIGIFNPALAGDGLHNLVYTYIALNGCSNTVTSSAQVYPTPMANAGPDKVVLEGGTVMLTPNEITNISVSYAWAPATWLNDPNIAKPEASPLTDFTYKLTVTSDKGCTTNDDVFVKMLKTPVIPNIFSPNGDGINDRWEIEYLDSYPGCVVQIYNRYGQLIYRIVNYTEPWDGKINGKDAPIGTYYYIIDPQNGRKQITGYVDIIR